MQCAKHWKRKNGAHCSEPKGSFRKNRKGSEAHQAATQKHDPKEPYCGRAGVNGSFIIIGFKKNRQDAGATAAGFPTESVGTYRTRNPPLNSLDEVSELW